MLSVLTQRTLRTALKAWIAARSRLGPQEASQTGEAILYFGYGANLDPDHLAESGVRARFEGTAVLHDHALEFSMPCEYIGVGYASVEPAPGSVVHGALYSMDRHSLRLLDMLEWVPFGAYRREARQVVLKQEGRSIEAQVYSAAYPRKGLGPPAEYRDWIVECGTKLGFPETYLKPIAAHPTCEPVEIDVHFDLLVQGRRRPGSSIGFLRPIYNWSDRLREWVADKW